MVHRQKLSLGLAAFVVVVMAVLVGPLGSEVLAAVEETEEEEEEYEFVDCFGFPLSAEDSETDVIRVTSQNLTAVNTSVRATNETPPGPNETFRLQSDSLQAADGCFSERVDENGSRLELIDVQTVNSTIIGPGLRTNYEEGTADNLSLYSPLTVEEFVQEFL